MLRVRYKKKKIIVASGFISCRKSLSQAETYDPEKSAWVLIPDPHHIHNSAYPRVMIDGNVHVWHKGLTTVQVLNKVGCERRVEDYGWLLSLVAIVQGIFYVMSHGIIFKP